MGQLELFIEWAWKTDGPGSSNWMARVENFLKAAGLRNEAQEFRDISGNYAYWEHSRPALVGYLEGLLAVQPPQSGVSNPQVRTEHLATHPNRIFIVHGHDGEAKEAVARFLERIGLDPIILHEQPSSGMTIVEKLEAFSNVGFAVVLLTPDDVGAQASNPEKLTLRARQNVILELGYFVGKLTRRRVCALYKGVEIPSDFGGVIYIEYDLGGGWRAKLAQELVEAKYAINVEALLKA